MMHSPERPTSAPKVTLEDLLRVKRAERPREDFWAHFERDLRAKQLAAIVEPRPWWIALRLPQLGRAVSYVRVPIGAAAVVALSMMVIREYRPALATPVELAVNVSETKSEPPIVQEPVQVAAVGVQAQSTLAARAGSPVAASAELATSAADGLSAGSMPAGESDVLMAMIPWAAPGHSVGHDEERSVAPSGELPQVHFASAIKPVSEHRFEGNVELTSLAVSAPAPTLSEQVPVAQISPVSQREVRRNHILASLVSVENGESDMAASGQSREVAASTLDSERLYDSVRRLGMGGDRLTLRF